MEHIDLTEKFQGYVWMSDRDIPEVFNNDKSKELILDENVNPFAVEVQLFDTEKEISYSVKYVDGKYLMNIYHLKEMKGCFTKKTFLSNRVGYDLVFNQYWKEEQDKDFCEGMNVLEPSSLVFVGFSK